MSDLMRALGLDNDDSAGSVLPNGVRDDHFMWSCLDTVLDPFATGGKGNQVLGYFGIHLSHEERDRLLRALVKAGAVGIGDAVYAFFTTVWYRPDAQKNDVELDLLRRALGTEYKLQVKGIRAGELGSILMVDIAGSRKPPVEPRRALYMAITAARNPGDLARYANGLGNFTERLFEMDLTGTLRVGAGKVDPLILEARHLG